MGLLDKIFGTGSKEEKNEKELPWIALDSMDQLETIKERSATKTQIIFKHSTRCGISRMVKKQFEASYGLTEAMADLYYLDLIAYREISNQLAQSYNVEHQSPQILVIKNQSVIAHASHGAIEAIDLNQFV